MLDAAHPYHPCVQHVRSFCAIMSALSALLCVPCIVRFVSPPFVQLAQSLRCIPGANDPPAFGLTFLLGFEHLGQSVEVPLGGEALLLMGNAAFC